MDYYSQFDMPSLEERKQDLIKYGKTLNTNVDEKELEHIVTDIVSETKKFSFTGYCVFGKKDEQEKLKNILDLKK